MRRVTRNFALGGVGIGSASPVSVQSMVNVRTADIDGVLRQIADAASAGCQIMRLSVDNEIDLRALPAICRHSALPLVADIQFGFQMAVGSLAAGCAGVRLNPGIVRDEAVVKEVAQAALEHDAVIRVGVNAGSLKPAQLAPFLAGGLTKEDALVSAMTDAALRQCDTLEKYGVTKIKVALKCSSPAVTAAAYRKFAAATDYPLHLGLTEAGTPEQGVIKTAAALGGLLLDGIGDTMRVSLTADPAQEITAARKILSACGLLKNETQIVSCPTCGRTEIDLVRLAGEVEALVNDLRRRGIALAYRKIAVMGCPVNGPGEARDADIGIAGSRKGRVIIFRKGTVLGAFGYEEGMRLFKSMLEDASAGPGQKE